MVNHVLLVRAAVMVVVVMIVCVLDIAVSAGGPRTAATAAALASLLRRLGQSSQVLLRRPRHAVLFVIIDVHVIVVSTVVLTEAGPVIVGAEVISIGASVHTTSQIRKVEQIVVYHHTDAITVSYHRRSSSSTRTGTGAGAGTGGSVKTRHLVAASKGNHNGRCLRCRREHDRAGVGLLSNNRSRNCVGALQLSRSRGVRGCGVGLHGYGQFMTVHTLEWLEHKQHVLLANIHKTIHINPTRLSDIMHAQTFGSTSRK
jgi:hypothetical protein